MNLCFFRLVLKQINEVVVVNNINYSYAKMCVPDVIKNLNVKVFNVMSRTNETRLQNGMKHINVSVNLEKMFVIINVRIKINKDMNTKN